MLTLLRLYFNIGHNNDGNKLLSETKDKIKNNPEFFNYYGLRSLYEGDFDDDRWHGEGKLYDDNGVIVYEGNFVNGVKD